MPYGLCIADSRGNEYLPSNALSFILYGKYTITIPANSSTYDFRFPIDIPNKGCPIQTYTHTHSYNNDYGIYVVMGGNPNVLEIAVQTAQRLPTDVKVDVFVFIPSYMLDYSKVRYGLERRDDSGHVDFATWRPLLALQHYADITMRVIPSGGLTGDFTYTYPNNVAVGPAWAGRWSPSVNWARYYFYGAYGNRVQLMQYYLARRFQQVAYSYGKTLGASVIDADAYSGFNNLSWASHIKPEYR